MATSGNSEVQPDHVIIWCDKNMAVVGNNEDSKDILKKNADVKRPASNESSADIDRFILATESLFPRSNYNDLIRDPLRMFIHENECMKCINDNIQAGKRVFLITSGEKGAKIIPQIHKILSGYIYVFCGQMALHEEEWAKNYKKDIEMFDADKSFFAKVLLDIGIYYLTKGQAGTENRTNAIQYLYWAHRLIQSATKVDGINRDDYLAYVNEGLTDLSAPLLDGYDADDRMGEDVQ